MSTKGQAILDAIKTLPPTERAEVLAKVKLLESRQAAWEEQRVALRALQSRHAGSGLLTRLLEERTKERARG